MKSEIKQLIIEVDEEFMDLLDKLKIKIKEATWGGLEKVSNKSATKVLARKIKAAKLI